MKPNDGVTVPLSLSKVWNEAERRAILDQLERMLATHHFSHSKRYPALLRHVVEQAVAGHGDQIKERTLGIEVFGRDPGYDTTQDPVVRTTAGEIRKRIAQYYQDPGHDGELHIRLPSGTYVPEFDIPGEPPPTGAVAVSVPLMEAPAGVPDRSQWSRPAWLLPSAITLIVAVVVLAAWFRPWSPRPALDRFWAPLLDSPNPALLCVGQPHFAVFNGALVPVPAPDQPEIPPASVEGRVSLDDLYLRGKHYISLWDSVTLSRVAAFLEAKAKRYRIRGELSTSLSDLREGPAVLVGGFNNDWTLRLTGPLRFSFVNVRPHIYAIHDRRNPSQEWVVNTSIPYLQQSEDYAVISRIKEPTTDRVVVVAAGVAYWGTIAAGEFLTDPKYMEEVAKSAPAGWERKNMQIVIGTKVIDGNSGPPRVLATYFW